MLDFFEARLLSNEGVGGLSRLGSSLGLSSPINKGPYREGRHLKERPEEKLGLLGCNAFAMAFTTEQEGREEVAAAK